ncbi:MAG: tetratricopeptide repeat protein [Phycisphaerales bacterium]
MNDWLDAEHHVERAHELFDAGRWDEAESELRRALSLNPYQAEWHFNLGLTLEAAGRSVDAASAFKDAFELSADPDSHAAMLVGVNLIRAGKPGDALDWLEKAEKLDPGSTEAQARRIEALSQLGRHEDAEELFYVAIQVDAENPELYAAMSDSLMDRGQHDKAVWCLREAARLDPELPRVQARLAEAYAATGRLERARQLYLRELRMDPGDVDTLLDLGSLLVDMHRPQEAAEKFRRVLEIEPDHAEAHSLLGDLAESQGDLGEALVQFDVVLRLDPEYPGARRRLAGLLLGRGREEDLPRARDLLRLELRASRLRPDEFDARALDELGLLLLDAGIMHEAVRTLRACLALQGENYQAHHHLSVALLEAGDVKGGVEHARRALSLQPRFVPAMHNLALAHLRLGQWLRARYWVRQASRIDPDDASLRRLRLMLKLKSLGGVGLFALRAAARGGRWGLGVVTRPPRSPA